MAKKQISYDLKAAKELFNEYLNKGTEKKQVQLPENTVKIDDLNRKNALDRLYKLIDDVIDQINKT